MLWRFITQYNQQIARFNFEYISGLLGKYNLTAFTHANGSEYVLTLGRYAFTGLLLVVMD